MNVFFIRDLWGSVPETVRESQSPSLATLDRQFSAALLAAAAYHVAAVAGSHTTPETMSSLALDIGFTRQRLFHSRRL